MEVTRIYAHSGRKGSVALGDIGAVRLSFSGTMQLDGRPLGPNATEHLLMFALQTLQDAYAGATTQADAVAAFTAKRNKLLDDTIGTRSGSAADPLETFRRAIVRTALKGGTNEAEYKKADDKSAWIDKFHATLTDEQKAAIEELAKEAHEDAVARASKARAIKL